MSSSPAPKSSGSAVHPLQPGHGAVPATGSDTGPETGQAIGPGPDAVRRVFVTDLVAACYLGVHSHEKGSRQRVRINLDLAVRDDGPPRGDDIHEVVCYEDITAGVRRLLAGPHVNLVETLAENIAAFCLEDVRVLSARVRVEKLDVFKDAASAGVEIERVRQST